MSKQRARDRAAREAAEAARRPATSTRRPAAGPPPGGPAAKKAPARSRKAPEPVYRLRRFPPLPWRLKAALALGWLAVVVLVLVFVPSWTARTGLVLLATAALPLVVVLVRDPSRRTR